MSDADARDVIEKALHDRHMADQNDPVLGGGDALRLNAHLYAFAVLDALAYAGYAVVRKSQIELFIDSLEFELEGMMSSRVDDVVGWMKAVFTGGDVEQWMPATPKWRVVDDAGYASVRKGDGEEPGYDPGGKTHALWSKPDTE